jgi:hypothetical protein
MGKKGHAKEYREAISEEVNAKCSENWSSQ